MSEDGSLRQLVGRGLLLSTATIFERPVGSRAPPQSSGPRLGSFRNSKATPMLLFADRRQALAGALVKGSDAQCPGKVPRQSAQATLDADGTRRDHGPGFTRA